MGYVYVDLQLLGLCRIQNIGDVQGHLSFCARQTPLELMLWSIAAHKKTKGTTSTLTLRVDFRPIHRRDRGDVVLYLVLAWYSV